MTRVCVVSALYHPNLGGLGRQAQLLSERLRRDGVDLFVISRRMAFPPGAAFSSDVEVVRIPTPFPGIRILEEISFRNILISLSFSLGSLFVLIRRRKRYDIVHFHGASIPLFIAFPFLRMMGKKVVAKVAAANLGTEAGSLSGRYWPVGRFLAWMMRRVDAFVAISDEIRDGLIRDGISPSKIHRISNFIDPEVFRPPAPGEKERLKADFGYPGKTLVLYAGRLVARKGVDGLLRAWQEVGPEFPDARLLLLGDGPLRGSLEADVERLGITETVRFGGRVDNVQDVMRAADLFILPSLQEGMPNSLLEAMACGLPAVATRIGGVVDIVDDRDAAVLVLPGNAEELARGIRKTLGETAFRERIGKQGLKTIMNCYGLETRKESYKKLYTYLE